MVVVYLKLYLSIRKYLNFNVKIIGIFLIISLEFKLSKNFLKGFGLI